MADSRIAQPIAISIIACGRRTDAGKAVDRYFLDDDRLVHEAAFKFKLWDLLSDSIHDQQCKRGEDYHNPEVVIAVMSQDKFAKVCLEIVQYVEGLSSWARRPPAKIIVMECNSGCHRASTCSKAVEALLNGLLDENGRRRFNALVFPVYAYYKGAAIQAEIESAVRWTVRPWTTIQTTPVGQSDRFGWEHIVRRPEACEQFKKIWEYVDRGNMERNANRSSSSGGRHSHPGYQETHIDNRPGPSTAPAPAAPAPAPAIDYGDLPPWARINNSPDIERCWKDELDRRGVDQSAQQSLFGLAMEGEYGRALALGLIEKLLKSDHEETGISHIKKPSAFIEQGVKNAWNQMDWGHRGSWSRQWCDLKGNLKGDGRGDNRGSKKRRK